MASPVPASQLVRHRWLPLQPRPGGRRRSGPWRGPGDSCCGQQPEVHRDTHRKPEASLGSEYSRATREAFTLCPRSQRFRIKLERSGLEGPCLGPLTRVSKQFQMPLYQELRESMTELSNGCQL